MGAYSHGMDYPRGGEEETNFVKTAGMDSKPAKKTWPLWQKLAILGLLIIIAVPLGVGLGVGLGRKSSNDDSSDSGSSDSNGDSSTNNNKTSSSNNTSIWQPKVGASWQIILLRPIVLSEDDFSPDVGIWDLDVYDNDVETFDALKRAGKKIICYFSAGSWENWRDDKDDFEKGDLGSVMDGWPDERWLNLRSDNVRKIMKKRIAYAADKGCDAIDPDNVDGFQNDNGVDLTKKDSVDFVKFLSETAASYNMSTGLKNAADLIPSVLDHVHFSVNEECVLYSECDTFSPFVAAGKPVFHIEYPAGAPNKIASSDVDEICSHKGNATGTEGFSTVIKKLKLDGWVEYCSGKTYTTEVEAAT